MFLLEDMLTVQTKKYFNFKRNKKKGLFFFLGFFGFFGFFGEGLIIEGVW